MKNYGFTLIELSVVIVIISILISSGFILSQVQTDKYKYDITISRLDSIEEALVQFLSLNGRLPCPTYLTIPPSDSRYGFEQITSLSSGPQSCVIQAGDMLSDPITGSNVAYSGAIPFKTLNLSNDFMFDGWNNKIFYTTFTPFINNHITNTSCTIANSALANVNNWQYICYRAQISPSSTFTSAAKLARTDTTTGQNVIYDGIYILVSAGPNGYGAYRSTADGSGPSTDRNTLPTAHNEQLNALNLQIYYMTGYKYTGTAYTYQTFDDILRFKTRNRLVYDCNKNYNLACTNIWGIDFR